MKIIAASLNRGTTWALLAAASLLPVELPAAETASPGAHRHHLGLGAPVWFKARARLNATRATDPGPTAGSAAERFYDDGFSRVDSSGNAVAPPPPAAFSFPRTSFFGYDSAAQVVNSPLPPDGGTLSLHSFALNGGDFRRRLESPAFPGIELTYRFDWKHSGRWRVGIEAGASYHYLKWTQSGAVNSTVDLITDTFALGGVTLAPAVLPYPGQFVAAAGDPVIGSTPTRTQATVPAVVNGSRALELHALQFRVGPAAEWAAGANWHLGLQTGVAVGFGFSQLTFSDQVTIAAPNTPVMNQSGGSAANHTWAGWFNALRISRRDGGSLEPYVDLRHTLQGSLNHNGPLRSGAIHLSEGFGVSAGVNWRF